jgi:hypothetical protein
MLNEPKGKVPKGKSRLITTASPLQKRRARRASFIATCKAREALSQCAVTFVGGMWCHEKNGGVTASFQSLGLAVAALPLRGAKTHV